MSGDAPPASGQRVKLPGTELLVSRVCLGTQQFSGSTELGRHDVSWGAMSQDTVDAIVVAALDLGINFFDCAEAYGGGHAEVAFGAALRKCGRRNEAVIASKFGKHKPLWETDDPTGAQTVYDGDAVDKALSQSMERLRVDCIDLYQIHWAGNIGIVGTVADCKKAGTWDNVCSAVAALERAKQEGRIRYWGVCNFGTEDMATLKAAGGGSAVSNQLPYSPVWRSIEHGVQRGCGENQLAILCYSPLMQGLLSGRVRSASDLPEGRRRTRVFASQSSPKSRHGGPGLEESLFAAGGALEELSAISERHGIALPVLSVAWLLSRDNVACVLVGASTPEQVARNAELVQVNSAALDDVTRATNGLLQRASEVYGSCVDQYAGVSRIHGNEC